MININWGQDRNISKITFVYGNWDEFRGWLAKKPTQNRTPQTYTQIAIFLTKWTDERMIHFSMCIGIYVVKTIIKYISFYLLSFGGGGGGRVGGQAIHHSVSQTEQNRNPIIRLCVCYNIMCVCVQFAPSLAFRYHVCGGLCFVSIPN